MTQLLLFAYDVSNRCINYFTTTVRNNSHQSQAVSPPSMKRGSDSKGLEWARSSKVPVTFSFHEESIPYGAAT